MLNTWRRNLVACLARDVLMRAKQSRESLEIANHRVE